MDYFVDETGMGIELKTYDPFGGRQDFMFLNGPYLDLRSAFRPHRRERFSAAAPRKIKDRSKVKAARKQRNKR